jgi:hypothetical protein
LLVFFALLKRADPNLDWVLDIQIVVEPDVSFQINSWFRMK